MSSLDSRTANFWRPNAIIGPPLLVQHQYAACSSMPELSFEVASGRGLVPFVRKAIPRWAGIQTWHPPSKYILQQLHPCSTLHKRLGPGFRRAIAKIENLVVFFLVGGVQRLVSCLFHFQRWTFNGSDMQFLEEQARRIWSGKLRIPQGSKSKNN